MIERVPGDGGDLPPTVMAWIDDACDRFEADWTAGRRPRIEEVLETEPEPWRPELLKHLLAVELACRRGGGEEPGLVVYRRRFPEHADLLDRVFAVTSNLATGAARAPDSEDTMGGSGLAPRSCPGRRDPGPGHRRRQPPPLPDGTFDRYFG